MAERPQQPSTATSPFDGIEGSVAEPDERERRILNTKAAVDECRDQLVVAAGVILPIPNVRAARASTAAIFAVIYRCARRALPLVSQHLTLGPLARKAVQTGAEFCLGRRRDREAARRDWHELANALVTALGDGPADTAVMAAPGLAALTTLTLLEAVADSARADPIFSCPPAIRYAALAVGAAFPPTTPLSVRLNELERLVEAAERDIDRLVPPLGHDESEAVDPDETGPFGALWPSGIPRVLLDPEPESPGRELTPAGERATLDTVPDAETKTQLRADDVEAELARLETPVGLLTPASSLAELTNLAQVVRSRNAANVARFRVILATLAGHKFADRESAGQTINRIQEVRTLLGLGFVLRGGNHDGVRVAVSLDTDTHYPSGRFRAVTTATPQKKVYNRTAFPLLDVIDSSVDRCESVD